MKNILHQQTNYLELLKKYNIPGPRYTSYPTVPYWSKTPTESEWITSISDALDESLKNGIGAAVYVHIPFCENLCTYCGCNTRITRNHKVGVPYVESVIQEWELYQTKLIKEVPISEIHLGGGTPTFLSPEELQMLVQGILKSAKTTDHFEFSVEADPRVTNDLHLKALYQVGFRRLSLGVQDFDPVVQEWVNRVQSEAQVGELTQAARELGYNSVNFDLIYGLPQQTLKSIEHTVSIVQRLRPDRIAFYAYAHVPWIKPGQRRFTEADLPSGEEKRRLYELGRKMLEEVGYREVGMDHFALPTDSLWRSSTQGTLHRNFMGYISRRVAPLFGLGVSAIGDSWTAFSQNEKLLETYQARVKKNEIPILRGHVLTREDLVLKKHILNLMTTQFTSWANSNLDTPFLTQVPQRLRELENDGLVTLTEHSCTIAEKGRPFLRNVCMAFDARLAEQAPAAQLFSQTI